jgi:low molecular weight protein-tyrosine phosphatase
MTPYRILFVCWGNICRSPTAEAILRARIADAGLDDLVEVDSAGTSSEHSGQPADGRAIAEARRRGVDMRSLRARRVRPDDWDSFDLILVADDFVERALLRQAPPDAPTGKLARFTAFGDGAGGTLPDEVPDPWYDGPQQFVEAFDLLDAATTGILAHVRQQITAHD